MRPAVVLAAWTLFVWGTRIRNADGAVGATAVAAACVALAVWLLVALWRAWPHAAPLLALSVLTVAVWVVRLVDIVAFSDHSAGFVIVHAALGAVSLALVSWAWRSPARRPAPA